MSITTRTLLLIVLADMLAFIMLGFWLASRVVH